jgi:hypothetical protein
MLTVVLVAAVLCSATLTEPTVESSLPVVPHGERGRHRPAGTAVFFPWSIGSAVLSAAVAGAYRGVWITAGILFAMYAPPLLQSAG